MRISMLSKWIFASAFATFLSFSVHAQCVYQEENGIVAVEAEDYVSQSLTQHRQWYLVGDGQSTPTPDPDPAHDGGASGGQYLEILPDTRVTHGDPLEVGVSFSNTPGEAVVIDYEVDIQTTGRYYVWVRCYSTGSEDNGVHVGLDGNWPASGARMQWCSGKNAWTWESKQRTDANHCGEPQLIYLDINSTGPHTISFSMREDGFEMDKFVLSQAYTKPSGNGPTSQKTCDNGGGGDCAAVSLGAINDFTNLNVATFAPAYADNAQGALAVNSVLYPDQFAAATTTFGGVSSNYDITLNTLTEIDGECTYRVKVGGTLVGSYTNPTSTVDYAPSSITFANVAVATGQEIQVEFNCHTNGEIPEGNGTAYARGRWTGIDFACSTGGTGGGNDPAGIVSSGEMKRWHKVTLTADGPNTNEEASTNPFTNYRMDVTFTHSSGASYKVPGFYSGCDDPTGGCSSGNKWKCHFAPDRTGTWSYTMDFKTGSDVAIGTGGASAGFFDGATGSLDIVESDKTGRDYRAKDKGKLRYIGEHYLRFTGTGGNNPNGDYFVKAGADAPENTLAYNDFDATPNRGNRRKTWQPHQQDYNAADASSYTWDGGKGTELLGVVNYLANKGLNAFSFLTLSLHGDDENVFPYLMKVNESTYNGYNDGQQWSNGVHHDRFDVSKLAQWERIFSYADQRGMFLHFKTLETENDNIMDNNGFGRERKIYYRELIARFGHHLALNWNLTEESTIPDAVVQQTSTYIKAVDPYDGHIVLHTYPGEKSQRYTPLLGSSSDLTGASLQTSNRTYAELKSHVEEWLSKSAQAGKKWVVAVDEPGNASIGIDNDDNGSDDKLVRNKVLWTTLLAGGTGVEYYYGYQTNHTDLDAQDHRSRDQKYSEASYALDFFYSYIIDHVVDMHGDDGVTSDNGDYVFAKDGELYVVYRPDGGNTGITLPTGTWSVQWFNPRTGGGLTAPQPITGTLSAPDNNDWVALVTNDGGISTNQRPNVSFTTPTGTDLFFEGDDLGVIVDASDPDGTIANVKLYLGGVLIREEAAAPYTWGTASLIEDDTPLLDVANGTYTLRAVAEDNEGATSEVSLTIVVQEKGLVSYSTVNDAYLQGANETNFNTNELRIENGNRVTYLMFDISNLPPGDLITSTLELVVGSDAGNGTLNIYQAGNTPWSEVDLSSATKPAQGALIVSGNDSYAPGQVVTFDMANADFTSNTVSFIVEMEAGGNDVSFASKENGSLAAPTLKLKVDDNVTANQIVEPITNISIYPNPAMDFILIEGNRGGDDWTIVGSQGQILSSGNSTRVEVSHLNAGNYHLRIGKHIYRFTKM